MRNQNFIPTLLLVSLIVCFILLLHTTAQNSLIIGKLQREIENLENHIGLQQRNIQNLENYIEIIQD